MQIYKFISYLKDGILQTKISEPITFYPSGVVNVTHARLCSELGNEGVVSKDVISVGAVAKHEDFPAVFIENTFCKNITVKDIIKSSINSKFQVEDSSQKLFDFAKER